MVFSNCFREEKRIGETTALTINRGEHSGKTAQSSGVHLSRCCMRENLFIIMALKTFRRDLP